MARRPLGRLLLACGATTVIVALALGMVGHPGAASAQPLPPRPTLTPQPPTAVPPTVVPPTVGPTSIAPTPADPDDADDDGDAAAEPARITGTVIDQRTGAPAPGLTVRVGDVQVTSDASGNYDRGGLAAGSYGVALSLAPEQGVAAQGELTVALEAGQTVVQHLFFSSPAPAEPPAATAVPTPIALPATGAAEQAWSGLLLLGLLLLGAGAATRVAGRRR